MEAFETLFKQIDKDGSGGIALDEFENFFTDPSAHAAYGLGVGGPQPAGVGCCDEHVDGEPGIGQQHGGRRAVRRGARPISMSDFVAARNDARDKPPQKRLTAATRRS